MRDNTLLYAGGAAVLAYFLFVKKTPVTATQPGGVITTPNAPAAPATYSDSYYLTYQYPAMVQANPNVTNPNYVLSQSEANQYLQNYLELQQWLPTVLPHPFPTQLAALQYHWTTYGVAQHYTFLPLIPPKNANWVHPPANTNSSGGSSTFSTILGTVASVAVAVLGPGETPRLNDLDIDLLMNGSAIAKYIVPMYNNANHNLSVAIDQKINKVLTDYL